MLAISLEFDWLKRPEVATEQARLVFPVHLGNLANQKFDFGFTRNSFPVALKMLVERG
jgi:hypothetical protein